MSYFRGLPNKDGKIDNWLLNELRPILKFQADHRKAVILEIRKKYLDLYFLGHAIKITFVRQKCFLNVAKAFRPERLFKWPVSFNDIKERYKKDIIRKEYKSEFEGFMSEVMFKIIKRKKGDISEGVSEMNHYITNRVAYDPGTILIIDRQVTFGKARIDLLGLRRTKNRKFSFVIIELKNKENKDIKKVFNQTKEYLDIIRKYYDNFQITYNLILDQKIKLGLLAKKNSGKIADKTSGKNSIEGIVILDNYNLRSSHLEKAVKNDWKKVHNSHNIKLFLKTNTFDNRFMWKYQKTYKFLDK